MTFAEFEKRCEPEAKRMDDALLRYVSSPQEHDLALPIIWKFIILWFEGMKKK